METSITSNLRLNCRRGKTLRKESGAAQECLAAALLVAAIQLLVAANSLRVSVAIPELVKLGDQFWLNCSAAQQNENEIYAIKWYKDDVEFYRFLPSAEPKVSVYETNGIQLDVSNNSATRHDKAAGSSSAPNDL